MDPDRDRQDHPRAPPVVLPDRGRQPPPEVPPPRGPVPRGHPWRRVGQGRPPARVPRAQEAGRDGVTAALLLVLLLFLVCRGDLSIAAKRIRWIRCSEIADRLQIIMPKKHCCTCCLSLCEIKQIVV